jgi:hypothetical protein
MGIAEDARRRKDEAAALRAGFDLDTTLVDTAEMYADGGAKALVAKRSPDAEASCSWSARSSPTMRRGPEQPMRASITCGASDRSTSICCTGAAMYPWRKRSAPLPRWSTHAGKICYSGVSNFDVVGLDRALGP